MDYAKLQEKYGGQFVACRGDEVVAAARTMGELLRILKEKNLISTDVTVEHVRPKGIVYAL